MTAVATETGRHTALSIGVVILIGVFCALLGNTLPVYLEVLARLRGLSESQAGLTAMADMGGYALGIIGCALLPAVVHRLNWRRTTILGVLLLIATNVLAIGTAAFVPFLVVRFFAGIGAGIATAIVYAALAEGDGARFMAFLSAAMLMSASATVPYFSELADRYGVRGLFGMFAGLGVLALLLTPLMPRGSARMPKASPHAQPIADKVTLQGWLAVLSVFVHWCGVGAVFGFISSMGTAWGGTEAAVELSVSKMLLAGMVGVILVAIVGSRFGSFRSLMVGYVGLLAALTLLLVLKPLASFLVVCALFGFIYNLMIPYQFEVVTKIDESSGAAMLVSAGMLGGVAIGPAIAGYLVTPDYTWVNGFSIASCALASVLMLVARRWHHSTSQARLAPANG